MKTIVIKHYIRDLRYTTVLKFSTMKRYKQIIDPAFLRDTNYSYVEYDNIELASVLCFALARHNRDLILHQQRIELFSKTQENKLLFSAIADLFISLEDIGTEYKKRIFDKYKPLLTSQQITILENTLYTKLADSDALFDLNESILSLGLQGQLLSREHIRL